MSATDTSTELSFTNEVLIALLFFTGYWWARYTVSRPWNAGVAFLFIGSALVAAAIALGG